MTVLFIIAAIGIPLVALRGRSLQRCFETELAMLIVFSGLAACGRVLRIDVDPYLTLVTAGVLFLAVPLGFLAFAEEIRWSANRAFVIAAIGYALMISLQLRTPIDGDEPYYLLMTESLVHDHDLDLTNQYRDVAHSDIGRPDLLPQPGDPRGAHGEQYSRHEPFLPILLTPGFAVGGLPGALAVIGLFGALLARSTIRFLEDEGIGDATTRVLFPLIAFGPPVIFYATRIWPEVPAAFFFLEAVRGIRQRRPPRWIAAIFALVLLKIRFGLLAVMLLIRVLRTKRQLAIAAAVVAVPLVIAWLISGNAMNTHSIRELLPSGAIFYWLGLFGLILDGAAGIVFQAPLYALAILALPRWRSMPDGFRLGMSASLLYLLYLIPRSEWHGGWSPPLRYIVVLMPILALGAATIWERIGAGTRAVIAMWTVMLIIHGAAFPWRLFHLATGENFIGESLSTIWRSDFSRLMPSFIRPNLAAIVGSVLLVIALVTAVILSRRSRTAQDSESPAGEPRGCEEDCDDVTVARGGALENPAPRSARGSAAPAEARPRRRPLQGLAPPDPFALAASAATKPVDSRLPRAKRGAGLSSAPPRAALISPRSLRRVVWSVPTPLIFAAILLAAFTYGRRPADRVEFEDAHVTHTGGEMFPAEWTVARFLYQGGWIVHRGDSLSFLAKAGRSMVRYQSQTGATIEVRGQAFVFPPTGSNYGYLPINLATTGRTTLRCIDGSANLDWMRHE
ncbi:MAG TPA: hypothetical protein VGQ65_08470 [Thermoanaerobaculia bacterium]|jgi:hypothetical protein|nr:hypothetical protein [Thermoanaerobaculia bacterium]